MKLAGVIFNAPLTRSGFAAPYILSLLLILSIQFAFGQTIHTVDNRPESGAMFTSINAAIGAATAGDIIHVHPSSITYENNGNMNLNKTLTIVALGHNLLNETNNMRVHVVNSIVSAPNCVVQGMYVSNILQSTGSDATGLKLLNNRFAGQIHADEWRRPAVRE